MKPKWTVRRLTSEDEQEFVPFLGQWVSNRDVAKHFAWLYRGNPHGDALTWVAVLEDSGRIIGCTSIFPRRMRLFGQPILGSFGGDAFVDPEFRRRGIAQTLHEHSVTDMRDLQIQCNYGFPVPANFRAFIRAGALDPSDFYTFRLPLNGRGIASISKLGVLAPIFQPS